MEIKQNRKACFFLIPCCLCRRHVAPEGTSGLLPSMWQNGGCLFFLQRKANLSPPNFWVPISLSSSATPHFREFFFFFFPRGAPKEHHTGEEHPCADGRACFIWINVLQRSDHCHCSTQKHILIQYSSSVRDSHTWVCNLYSFITIIIPAYKQDRMMKKLCSQWIRGSKSISL